MYEEQLKKGPTEGYETDYVHINAGFVRLRLKQLTQWQVGRQRLQP